jgi:hypothetical protein
MHRVNADATLSLIVVVAAELTILVRATVVYWSDLRDRCLGSAAGSGRRSRPRAASSRSRLFLMGQCFESLHYLARVEPKIVGDKLCFQDCAGTKK